MQTGELVKLNNVNLYKTSKAQIVVDTLNGDYYYWNDSILNNRIRVTDKQESCGQKDQFIGWIKIENDLPVSEPLEDPQVVPDVEQKIETVAYTEIISETNSFISAYFKYFNNIAMLDQAMKDNNIDELLLPYGTEVTFNVPIDFDLAAKNLTPTIIMICGPGSAGKSTYAKKLIKYLNLTDYTPSGIDYSTNILASTLHRKPTYNEAVQHYHDHVNGDVNFAEHPIIILESLHRNKTERRNVLNKIYNINKFNFICISLLPDPEYLVYRYLTRQYKTGTSKEELLKLSTIAIHEINNYRAPDLTELWKYSFKNIALHVIKNNDEVTENDLLYIIKDLLAFKEGDQKRK